MAGTSGSAETRTLPKSRMSLYGRLDSVAPAFVLIAAERGPGPRRAPGYAYLMLLESGTTTEL